MRYTACSRKVRSFAVASFYEHWYDMSDAEVAEMLMTSAPGRGHPMQADKSKRKPNRLINSSSPYLLQHAHNPVDWYPWGPERSSAPAARISPSC